MGWSLSIYSVCFWIYLFRCFLQHTALLQAHCTYNCTNEILLKPEAEEMKSSVYTFGSQGLVKQPFGDSVNTEKVQLVLCFGDRELLSTNLYPQLKSQFPAAKIAMVSSAGEICHTQVLDKSVTVTALEFVATELQGHSVKIADYDGSVAAGEALLQPLVTHRIPSYVFVFSDGRDVNGSELVKGLNQVSKGKFLISGGLAGDGSAFQMTMVGLDEEPAPGKIIAIALYSDRLRVSHGTKGGWEPYGFMKMISKSKANVLYEIEGENALAIYKNILGPDAAGLPETALLYPLSIYLPGNKLPVVRTILSVDEDAGSMTFAGDVPEGTFVRFMRANFDKITNAASIAAVDTKPFEQQHQYAMLISCVGRKLILGAKTNEEVKAVDLIYDHRTPLSGFYSYGEISPLMDGSICQLHNQTMTITGFSEI